MKTCSRCKVEKSYEEFHRRGKGYQPYCKPCMKERNAEYWKSQRGLTPHRKAIRQKNIEKARRFVYDYLLDHPCVDCGETDPIVLEFDHKDTETKFRNVSHLVNRSASEETLLIEIEKCDVRCANCHRRKTATQFGWKITEY